ncbi:hypothetical protein HYQ41_09865 [Facklamia sp. DSM 111019]|nr:hypothetical protein [Facklamia lactis]
MLLNSIGSADIRETITYNIDKKDWYLKIAMFTILIFISLLNLKRIYEVTEAKEYSDKFIERVLEINI